MRREVALPAFLCRCLRFGWPERLMSLTCAFHFSCSFILATNTITPLLNLIIPLMRRQSGSTRAEPFFLRKHAISKGIIAQSSSGGTHRLGSIFSRIKSAETSIASRTGPSGPRQDEP